MHICVSNLTIIGSDNGFWPGRHQAIIWSNSWVLLIGAWGINFSEILIAIYTFSFKKMHLRMSSGKWRPVCLCLNVLILFPLGGCDYFFLHQSVIIIISSYLNLEGCFIQYDMCMCALLGFSLMFPSLHVTHWGRVTHICITKLLAHHGFR